MKNQKLDETIDHICRRWNVEELRQSSLIPILQDVQSTVGYLTLKSLRMVSNKLRIPLSHVYGVATFYHQFRLRPEGKHSVSICRGTACHIAGISEVYESLVTHLNLDNEEDTSNDGLFTVKQVRCLGACSLAPIMKVGEEVYGTLDPKKVKEIIDKYRATGEA